MLLKLSDSQVINHYSCMVYKLAFAKSGSKFDADDIFQEVFIRYIKKKPVFESENHRKAWLIRVTINCSITLLKNPFRKNTQKLDEQLEFRDKEILDLYNELQNLPQKYRDVIHLFYYEQFSIQEISSILKRKPSTIRTQLTRARDMLKQFISEEDYYEKLQ
ncbi:MAG: sigma-70 family RNA polymerase sigma factor [Clostridia bacterium]